MLGAIIQGGFIRPIVQRLGDKPTFIAGALSSIVGLVAAAVAQSVTMFALALVPLAFGIGFGHPTMSSLVSRAGRGDEQGRVQGAASAVESLGRTIGPVWGNASLQRFGEAMPYISAAAFLVLAVLLRHRTPGRGRLGSSLSSSSSVSCLCTSRSDSPGRDVSSRQPRQLHVWQRNGTRPVTLKRSRSVHPLNRE